MKKVSELGVGLNVTGEYATSDSVILRGRLGYLTGTGSGQSNDLSSKKNTAVYFTGVIEWALGQGSFVNFGFNYMNRASTVEGPVGATTDQWDNTVEKSGLQAGYVFEFGGR
jgi:hypothetical protein